MALDYDRLPAKLRARVDAQEGRQPRARGSTGSSGNGRWRCATCGQTFVHQTGPNGWQDHDPTHTRIECVLIDSRTANRVTSP